MGKYIGMVELGGTLKGLALVRSGDTPINSDALLTYRVYGSDGIMANGTGTTSFKDSASITGATHASPIVVTSAAHGLSNGTRVTITGVGGNTAANGTFVVANKTADTFELEGSTGNGAYTSGGTWNATGLYEFSISCISADGYEAGQNYTVVVNGEISSTGWGDSFTFTVV